MTERIGMKILLWSFVLLTEVACVGGGIFLIITEPWPMWFLSAFMFTIGIGMLLLFKDMLLD